MTVENNHYKTSDTALAAYLVTEGNKLLNIDYSQPRYEFTFPQSEPLQECVSKFIIGAARTDPAVFNKVNKKLLRIVRNQVQWEED